MKLLKRAASQLGVKEIRGEEDNEQIVQYATESSISGINDDETPWCSTFVNWCAMKEGLAMSKKANARSWLTVGNSTMDDAEPGDVVVFWRESRDSWKGHVGVFLGYSDDGKKVHVLGGNQGNAVSVAQYDARKVLDIRRLTSGSTSTIPEPTLKRGSKGTEVSKLQKALDGLGFDCGVDGDFGSGTEKALRAFQTKHNLQVDGIYGNGSKTKLESLLQE